MNKALFEAVRQEQGPVKPRETTFEFLQRGGRKEAVEIRQWIEAWFQAVPSNLKKRKLEGDLKSKRFSQFLGALFELEVYEILKRICCAVEIEPTIPNSNGETDFRANCNGYEFYVEATVCGIGKGELHSNENEYDFVEKLRNDPKPMHSDLWLNANGELRKTLGRKHVTQTRALFSKCSREEVKNNYREYGEWQPSRLPSVELREGDWILKCRLQPAIATNGFGDVYGPVRSGCVDGVSPFVKALTKKTIDWKDRRKPSADFFLAVNICHSNSFYPEDVERAIYGNRQCLDGGAEFEEYLSSVNGVIVFNNATLGNECSAKVKLYMNKGKNIPNCLRFLLQEQRLGDLLGIGLQ